MSVRELKPGMRGTATITTTTTVTPVSVTEVKNCTFVTAFGTAIIVRTNNENKMFSQGDIDKRGVNSRGRRWDLCASCGAEYRSGLSLQRGKYRGRSSTR